MQPRHKWVRLAALVAAMAAAAPCVWAQTYRPPAVDAARSPLPVHSMVIKSAGANETLHIKIGESTILGGSVLRRVYVGNPAVLQTFTAAPDQVVLTAKAAGVSSLVLWDTFGHSRLYTVDVDMDPAGLQAAIASEFPDVDIEVVGGQDMVTLKGTVATQAMADAVGKLAATYTKAVVNSLRVASTRPKQVQLKLQFIEVDRSKLEQFGINIAKGLGSTTVGTTTQQFTGSPLNIALSSVHLNLDLQIQDLEQKNLLQILAEPTLTTVSGQEAKFLSGGEFPFPVVQSAGVGNAAAVTIQFRPYGVRMEFTPTVNPDGSIHLKISPEVSSLDYSNAVTISGFTIPALSTRRAETEVEVRNGESFAMSGLLDHRTTENLSKVPGIADIPILGQLFRSKNITHSVTELVVVVTAKVVDPIQNPADMVQPTWAAPNMTSGQFDQRLHKERPLDVPSASQPTNLEKK